MESFIENLPWMLAALLGLSEALAHIPALKSNSILQMVTGITRKAMKLFPKKIEAPKEESKDSE